MNSFITQLWTKFDGAMTGLFSSVSSGISNYVIPIAWIVLAIILLWWCFLTISGKTSTPVLDWIVPCISFMLVLHVMGSGYMEWIANPLWKLPDELLTATGKATGSDPFQQLGTLWQKFSVLLSGVIWTIKTDA